MIFFVSKGLNFSSQKFTPSFCQKTYGVFSKAYGEFFKTPRVFIPIVRCFSRLGIGATPQVGPPKIIQPLSSIHVPDRGEHW